MKKNLIKILAISTLVFGLGACDFGQQTNKSEESSKQESSQQSETSSSETQQSESSESSEEEAIEATITELLDLNAQGKWTLEGKKVVVKGLAVAAFYGNTLIGSTALGTTVNTLRAIQINYDEIDPLPEGARNIFSAEINAEGVLEDEEGHAVINHAKVTITNARLYDENGNRVPDTGASVYYWGDFSRTGFGGYVGRALSFPTRGVYQLASLPGEISADEEATFEVVFPGENLDTEDLDNDSLITCYIPAGISAGQAAALNEFFADAEVGDGVDMFAMTYFNYTVCGGAGFLLDSYWAELAAAELDIQQTWAEAVEKVQDSFIDPIPNMGYDEKAISYLVDFDPDKAPDDVLQEAYVYIDKALWGVTNTATFTINFKAEEDTEAAVANIASVLEAAGWESKLDEDGAAGYVLVQGGKTVSQALYEWSDTQITIYYMAHDETVGYNTAAEIMDIYEAGVNALMAECELVGEFESAIDLTTTAEAESQGYLVDISDLDANLDDFDDLGLVTGLATLSVSFADADTAYASYLEIYENLANAGFVDGIYNDYEGTTGLFNETSQEWLTLSFSGTSVLISVSYLNSADGIDALIFAASPALASALYANYASYFMAGYAEYFGFYAAGPVMPAFDFGEGVAPVESYIHFADLAKYLQYGILNFYMEFYFEDLDTAEDAYDAYVALLEAADFVAATEDAFNGVPGFVNTTTGEFVILGVDEDLNSVYAQVLIHGSDALANYVTVL